MHRSASAGQGYLQGWDKQGEGKQPGGCSQAAGQNIAWVLWLITSSSLALICCETEKTGSVTALDHYSN